MKARGAVVRKTPADYEVVELDVDEPRQGEIMVKMVASGLCHSDDHIANGSIPMAVYPVAGGHEGAGIIARVGPNTPGWSEGDQVVFSFLPSCGRCRWCATGRQNLCDDGIATATGARPDDPSSYRLALDGAPVSQMCGISTFCEYTTTSVTSAVKVSNETPLDKACLLGCGVGTGWGSAVNSAQVYPGQTVIVMGIGGVGINAVQGAVHAGAAHVIAVDPVLFKREAALRFGATHAVDSMEEAGDIACSFTNGQGADSAIVTTGLTTGDHVAQAFSTIRKAGTCVVTGISDPMQLSVPISLLELTTHQKRLQGSLFGACCPTMSIPWMLDLYNSGNLKLDELITAKYSLDEVSKGYEDMRAGRNIRGVILYDS